jgi:hypothetical protein
LHFNQSVAMAPVALQMRLAANRTSVQSAQKGSAPVRQQRMAVQQRFARHVVMATKVEELENSSKTGALLFDTRLIMMLIETALVLIVP